MPIRKQDVIDAVLKGIARGNKKYENMTGGYWLTDSGAEGFMVANVADWLHEALGDNESLLLETQYGWIQEWSGASRPRGRPPEALKGKPRADIAVFNAREKPAYVIELKRSWDRKRCFTDIRRLRATLRQCARQVNGSLKHGILGLMIVESGASRYAAQRKIRDKAAAIQEDVQTSFKLDDSKVEFSRGDMRRFPNWYKYDEEWFAAGFCITLSS